MSPTPGQRRDLGAGCHAWILGAGHWGENNTGLVVADGESLLVDTHMDLGHTADMLAAFATLTEENPVSRLVNTHSDGDHWFGNELLDDGDVEIIASEAAAAVMTAESVATFQTLWHRDDRIGDFVRDRCGHFDLSTITRAARPSRTFSGELTLDVGGRTVELLEVGPAHTEGDVVVHVPDAAVVFTGDIVFAGAAPLVWHGPVSRCLAALDRIASLQPQVVVPGHGPLTDLRGVERARSYLEHVLEHATRSFEHGLSRADAVAAVDLSAFADLVEHERIETNIDTIYRELDPDRPVTTRLEHFDHMAEHLGFRPNEVSA